MRDELRAYQASLGRLFAEQRLRLTSRCVLCHREMVGLKTKRYCSNACQQRAKYARKQLARVTQL